MKHILVQSIGIECKKWGPKGFTVMMLVTMDKLNNSCYGAITQNDIWKWPTEYAQADRTFWIHCDDIWWISDTVTHASTASFLHLLQPPVGVHQMHVYVHFLTSEVRCVKKGFLKFCWCKIIDDACSSVVSKWRSDIEELRGKFTPGLTGHSYYNEENGSEAILCSPPFQCFHSRTYQILFLGVELEASPPHIEVLSTISFVPAKL